jgi:ADP-ribose pyrophosphatase YjhB (NUDIX family)
VENADATRKESEEPAGEVPTWLRWARRLQALAQSGLTYTRDPYDAERYEALRALAAEMLAAHAAGMPQDVVQRLFTAEVGYATPKLDVRGVVFRDDGALLLVRERSDGGWTLPGGWADVGESASEAVEKEVREESGYVARATKLIALLDRDRHGHPPHAHHIWKVFIRCSLIGGEAAGPGLETEDVGFFHADAVPPLSLTRVVRAQITRLFEHYAQPDLPADFD